MAHPAAVLFDFGGVVIPGPFEAFAAIARERGVSPDAVREINSRNPDTNAWARAERGELDADGFAAGFEREAREAGHELYGQDVLDVLTAMTPDRERAYPDMVDAIERCRAAGCRVGLITNNIASLAEEPSAAWVFERFDAVVESSVVGARKPEPRIYELALAALGAEAERTVMLDDLGINLRPARAMGMRTLKVVDPVASAAELVALLEG